MNVRIVSTLAALVVAAGCLGPSHANAIDPDVAATRGFLARGGHYDGVGIAQFSGGLVTVFGVDDAANTAQVVATGRLDGHVWKIEFLRFAGNASFEGGGIAMGLDEHGGTGHGTAELPSVHSDVAGWGSARVSIDGVAAPDPISGADTWDAHFMVLSTATRDPVTHGISNAKGDAPYSTEDPVSGRVDVRRPEVHVVLRSATAAVAPPAVEVTEGPVLGTAYARDVAIVSPWAGARLSVGTTVWSARPQGVNLTFELRTPKGQPVAQWKMGGQTTAAQWEEKRPPQNVTLAGAGTYHLMITGTGVGGGYTLNATLAPPAASVLDFWFEHVVHGQAARDLAMQRSRLLGS